jgi:hypothetical protein
MPTKTSSNGGINLKMKRLEEAMRRQEQQNLATACEKGFSFSAESIC